MEWNNCWGRVIARDWKRLGTKAILLIKGQTGIHTQFLLTQTEFLITTMRVYYVPSVVSNSLWPFGLQTTTLLCPWDSPGKKTGVGCHVLLQRIFPIQGLNLHLLHLLHWLAGSLLTSTTTILLCKTGPQHITPIFNSWVTGLLLIFLW